MKTTRPEDKITFDTEKAVRKERDRLAIEQAKLDGINAYLHDAETHLGRMKVRAEELAALVPLGGATQAEADEYDARMKAVARTVATQQQKSAEQAKVRDRAAAELERATEQAREALLAEAKRIAGEQMKHLMNALSEAVKANLAVYWLGMEMREKGIEGASVPQPMMPLLPTHLQIDGGRATASEVSRYKSYLKQQCPWWNADLLFDGGVGSFDGLAERGTLRERMLGRFSDTAQAA